MTELAKIAALAEADRVAAAVQTFRASRPDATISEIFGTLYNGGFEDAGVAVVKWDAARPENAGNVEVLKSVANLFYGIRRYRDAEPFAEELCRRQPDNGVWYGIRAWARFVDDDPEGVAAIVAEAQKKNTECGIDFQPSLPPDLSGIAAEMDERRRQRRRDRLAGGDRDEGPPAKKTATAKPRGKGGLKAATGAAAEIGLDRAVLSGRISGATAAADYCFRWGLSKNDLDRRTPWKPLPPGAWGEIRSPILECGNQWLVCAAGHAADPDAGGVKLTAPFGKDRNHLSGVGVADLLGAWMNTLAAQEMRPRGRRAAALDLRDAELTLRVKAENLDPRGFLFTFNTQSVEGGETDWRSAPWTRSGEPVDLAALPSGRWQDIETVLSADPEAWSFCGNNPTEQGNHARYAYAPLGAVLERQTGNLFLWMLYGDWRETPSGALWLGEGRLRYRDWSILRDRDFAKLVEAPKGGDGPPERLTDGRRGHPGDGWTSAGLPPGANSFGWRFAEPVALTDIVMYQHPLFPARRGQIEIESGGARTVTPDFEMPEFPPTARAPIVMKLPEGLMAESFRLTLLEGYHDGIVGLEAVEAYSDSWQPSPGSAPSTVSEDIGGLDGGAKIHYALCCRTGDRETAGKVRSLAVQASDAPVLFSLTPFASRPDKAVFLVRGNAMGRETRLIWWTDKAKPREIAFGHEDSRQHRAITLCGRDRKAHTLRVRLENDAGESRTLKAEID